jgi:hypothetical protein
MALCVLLQEPAPRLPRTSISRIFWRMRSSVTMSRHGAEGSSPHPASARCLREATRSRETAPRSNGSDGGTASSRTLRPALYHWMRRNHDSLTTLFDESTPAWATLAETFAGMSLTDREAKSPTPKKVRMTWYRARLTAR